MIRCGEYKERQQSKVRDPSLKISTVKRVTQLRKTYARCESKIRDMTVTNVHQATIAPPESGGRYSQMLKGKNGNMAEEGARAPKQRIEQLSHS